MRLGIAIPCYNKHISRCLELLDSINTQTRLPDNVVVSCSSCKPEDFPIQTYKFPLQVLTTEERKNSSENRNIAARALDTDLICFFDADDLMHPQRLEAIYTAFLQETDIVLHGFFLESECAQEFPVLEEFTIRKDILSKCRSGCIRSDYGYRIHHGQASVTKDVFAQVQFPEEHMYQTREDCVFCFHVFSLPNIRSSYIAHPLSKYIPSGSVVYESSQV